MEKDGCLSENVGMVENGYIVVVGRMVEFKGRKERGSGRGRRTKGSGF